MRLKLRARGPFSSPGVSRRRFRFRHRRGDGGIHRLGEHCLAVVVAMLQHTLEGHRDLRMPQQRAGTWARPERGGGVGVHEDTISRSNARAVQRASTNWASASGVWSTAPLWRVNGAAAGLLSIGALLILYWSSIVPLLVAVFWRPPAPGGRDEGTAPEHPQLVHPPVRLLPHPDKRLRAFQGHMRCGGTQTNRTLCESLRNSAPLR